MHVRRAPGRGRRDACDPAFRDQVCVDQRATKHTVSIDGVQGDPMKVHIEYSQPTDKVPGFARKFVGSETDIVQSETWTSPEHGDIHVTIPGKPGELTGTAVLTERDGVTTETVTLDITGADPARRRQDRGPDRQDLRLRDAFRESHRRRLVGPLGVPLRSFLGFFPRVLRGCTMITPPSRTNGPNASTIVSTCSTGWRVPRCQGVTEPSSHRRFRGSAAGGLAPQPPEGVSPCRGIGDRSGD